VLRSQRREESCHGFFVGGLSLLGFPQIKIGHSGVIVGGSYIPVLAALERQTPLQNEFILFDRFLEFSLFAKVVRLSVPVCPISEGRLGINLIKRGEQKKEESCASFHDVGIIRVKSVSQRSNGKTNKRDGK